MNARRKTLDWGSKVVSTLLDPKVVMAVLAFFQWRMSNEVKAGKEATEQVAVAQVMAGDDARAMRTLIESMQRKLDKIDARSRANEARSLANAGKLEPEAKAEKVGIIKRGWSWITAPIRGLTGG